ncbi:MAG TPA: hypothetical protein VMD04_04980 [Candidatus Margulisiibacteriota bacterium]|nr:hypothetical protein [Candidatus Margulisiibacteriota bacterium]
MLPAIFKEYALNGGNNFKLSPNCCPSGIKNKEIIQKRIAIIKRKLTPLGVYDPRRTSPWTEATETSTRLNIRTAKTTLNIEKEKIFINLNFTSDKRHPIPSPRKEASKTILVKKAVICMLEEIQRINRISK